MLIWLGNGSLRVGKEFVEKDSEFDEEKVDSETLEKLIAQKKIGEPKKVKVVKKKKDKNENSKG